MKKWTMITLGLLSVAAVATTAMAYGPGRGPGYGPLGGPGGQGINRLDLTTEQMAKINKLRESHFNETKALRDQMTTKRDALRKLWLEANPDQAKITAAQKELNVIRDQMQDKMTAFRLEANKVLTPEQKEKAVFYRGTNAGRGGMMAGPGKGGAAGCPAYGPQGRSRAGGPGSGPMRRNR
jgi:zinc resistance-associated protein